MPTPTATPDLRARTQATGNVNSASSAANIKTTAGISLSGLGRLNERRAARGQPMKIMPRLAPSLQGQSPYPAPAASVPTLPRPAIPLPAPKPLAAVPSPSPSPSPVPMAKTGSQKYANEYFDSLKRTVAEYKPFNSVDASTHGAPVGAALGAVIGGTMGAAQDPGRDDYGQKKSRIKNTILGVLAGGAIGGLGTAAVPAIGQGVLAAKDRAIGASVGGGFMPRNEGMRQRFEILKTRAALPFARVEDLT